jgi:hypothetical protein
MIDLETLGSTPGCPILSIGAAEFFPSRDSLGERFYKNVDLQSCIGLGLKPEGGAFYWWLQQSQAARLALVNEVQPLSEALLAFGEFVFFEGPKEEQPCVWGHGPSFDLAVLSAAYAVTPQPKPWHYRQERDTRTILDLAGMRMGENPEGHHALRDAETQALTIMTALRKIGA